MEFVQSSEAVINSLDSAKVIVAGGKGCKTEKGFEVLKELDCLTISDKNRVLENISDDNIQNIIKAI